MTEAQRLRDLLAMSAGIDWTAPITAADILTPENFSVDLDKTLQHDVHAEARILIHDTALRQRAADEGKRAHDLANEVNALRLLLDEARDLLDDSVMRFPSVSSSPKWQKLHAEWLIDVDAFRKQSR